MLITYLNQSASTMTLKHKTGGHGLERVSAVTGGVEASQVVGVGM